MRSQAGVDFWIHRLGRYFNIYTILKKAINKFKKKLGCAVITKKDAALFTDGRYFLQASQQLDDQHWKLMKSGLPGVPTWQEYLVNVSDTDVKVINAIFNSSCM